MYTRHKYLVLIIGILTLCLNSWGQLPKTIPWSSSLNINFDDGTTPPSPLAPWQTDFSYTSGSPSAGQYSYILSCKDAGHLYNGPFVNNVNSTGCAPVQGYSMIAAYNTSSPPTNLFKDTVRNLCGGRRYLFWAGIRNLLPGSSCASLPRFTFSIETLSGAIIDTSDTGTIGGPLATDNYAWYPGYYDPTKRPPFPFYGKVFDLPPATSAVVLKVRINAMPPTSPTGGGCVDLVEIDNILLTAIGPTVKISTLNNPDGFITGACFQGDVPAKLTSRTDTGYLNFGTPNFILASYTNPAYHWQQSLDNGYTWTDLPGETNYNLSHIFNNPDTFWVRLRVSEASDINNPNCSNYSNLVQVQVDSFQKNVSFTSNSPVCTDGDLNFTLSGGASYITTGPNGYFDNSPYPHIHYPHLVDSGWYYTQVISFGGCKTKDSAYVKIAGVELTLSSDQSICYGQKVQLHASGGITYEWSPADGLSSTKIPDPFASPLKSTTYQIKASDNNGCSAYGNIKVKLRDSILEARIIGPDVSCPGDINQFIDTSAGVIVTRLWNFGNGIISILKLPAAQTYPPGNGDIYTIQLSVTDTAGCTNTVKHYLKSVNNCFIAVPSAFTPNHDGLNDYLYPLNAYKARDLEFKVFNRYGKLIFETKDWTKKWDGTYRGELQPTSTFVWMLDYTDEHGKRISQKGTVTLIR